MVSRRLILGALGSSCVGAAWAAKKPQKVVPAASAPSAQPAATPVNPWLKVPMADGVELLPEYWAGHDLETLTRAALPLLTRDKFDTDEQTARRVADRLDQVVYGDVRLSSRLAFSAPVTMDPPSQGFGFRVSYDPKRQVARVTHAGDGLWPGPDSTLPYSQLHSVVHLVRQGTYEGQNSYGAKATVEKELMTSFNLLGTLSGFRSTYQSPDIELESDLARRLLPELRVLVIGSLFKPYVHTRTDRLTPTVTNPVDTVVVAHNLTMQVERVVVFAGPDRKVLYAGDVGDKL